jgi:predicted Zn-dependent protease
MNRKSIGTIVATISLIVSPFFCGNARADDNSLIGEPTTLHRIYSDVNMRLSLAIKSNMDACIADQCHANQQFDERVNLIGQQLATTAYDLYPNLSKRVPSFQFAVVDKEVQGTASNANGDIVVFRGLQQQDLNDEALSFIIAREMGHVIGKHHTKNTSTKLIISAVASVVFPVAGIIAASSTAAQASTMTSVVTSAASTATSLIGAKVAMIQVKPDQLAESDAYANSLLESQSQDYALIVKGLPEAQENASDWLNDLQKSKRKLQARLQSEDATIALAMKVN